MKNLIFLSLLIGGFLTVSCSSDSNRVAHKKLNVPAITVSNGQFSEYWYAGKAEIDSYILHQARYGEVHEGKAVLIFVAEPFSKSKLVKLDNPQQAGADEQTVLKFNFTKKFNTGIYPYSMMLSAFTPVETKQFPNTPKVTMSSQEWCGHVFSQLKLQKEDYELSSYSYFEHEGDINIKIKKALLEDEIWNKIRLDYKSLPIGKVQIIPGLFYTRLLHESLKAVKVTASLIEEDVVATYTLKYPARELTIKFERAFPHKILSWKETFTGLGGKEITTFAELDKTLLTDYWRKHTNADAYLRDSLNLQ
jgi:hypothetical protein